MGLDGKRLQRSTGETNQSKALAQSIEWEKPYRNGLSEEKSCFNALSILREHRSFLSSGELAKEFRGLYEDVFRVEIEAGTVRRFAESWLKRRESEIRPRSFITYKSIINRFVEFLGKDSDMDLRLLQKEQVLAYRDSVAERLSPRTVNNHIRSLRVLLNDARRDALIDRNPADDVRRLPEGRDSERRAFTPDELRSILALADCEWKGLLLFGLYTGQRLGDVVRLTWANIDVERREIRLMTNKTGRRINVPMMKPLADYLAEIDTPRESTSPLFPNAFERAERYGANGPLSKEFRALLVEAGLVQVGQHERSPRKSPNHGKGRSQRRSSGNLSFHCLRHTATSMMKNSGVSEAVVRDIIGHSSAAVSALYTHIESEPKREALEKMPDITI